MGNRDLPDIYALARGPQARGRGHIYQANPDCPCYKLYILLMYIPRQTTQKIINL